MAENMIAITVTGIKLTGKPAVITATTGAVIAAGYCLVNHKTILPRLEEFFSTRFGGFVEKFGIGSLLVTVVTETAEAKNLMVEQAASGKLLNALNNMEGLNAEERFEKLEIVELHTKMVTSHELEQIKHEAQRNVQSALEHGLKEERTSDHLEMETEETIEKRTIHVKKCAVRSSKRVKRQAPTEAIAETSKQEISQQTCSVAPLKKQKPSHPRDPLDENDTQQQKYCLEDIFINTDCKSLEEAFTQLNRLYSLPARMIEGHIHLRYYAVLMKLRHYDKAKQVRAKLREFTTEKIEVNGEELQEFALQLCGEERSIEAIFFYTLAAEAYMGQEKDRERSEGLVTCVEGLTAAAINFDCAETGQKPYLGDNVFPLIEKIQEEISEAAADKVHQARIESCVGQFALEIFKHRDKALKLLEKAAPVLQASDLYQKCGDCFMMIGTIYENESKFADAIESFKKAKDCFKKEKKKFDTDDSEETENLSQNIKVCEKSIKKCALRLEETRKSDSGHLLQQGRANFPVGGLDMGK